jgi:hypothetical protein
VNEGLTVEDNVEVVIQVSAKTRSKVSVPRGRSGELWWRRRSRMRRSTERKDVRGWRMCRILQALGASRFDFKYSAGTLPHEAMMRSIELYGREVIPRVRELVKEASPATTGQAAAEMGS